MYCFSKAGIGNNIKRQQVCKQAKECCGCVCGRAGGCRWMWWGLRWTQQLINSDVNTVTLHNHWYNYIKKANKSWLYSCFSTCTSYWERKTPFWTGGRRGLISSSSGKSGTKDRMEGWGWESKVLHGTAQWGRERGEGQVRGQVDRVQTEKC